MEIEKPPSMTEIPEEVVGIEGLNASSRVNLTATYNVAPR